MSYPCIRLTLALVRKRFMERKLEIQKAIDQTTPLIMRYAQLTRAAPNENSPKESFQKIKNLILDIDKLLSRQFYLSQALEETSHVLYWDISEGDLG